MAAPLIVHESSAVETSSAARDSARTLRHIRALLAAILVVLWLILAAVAP